MGIYDAKILTIRKQIDSLYEQIKKSRRDVDELETILEKYRKTELEFNDSLNRLFRGIDVNKYPIQGNFSSYYKKNIAEIAKQKGLCDIPDKMVKEKKLITAQIASNKKRISQLRDKIELLENDLAYFEENNVNPKGQVN